MDLLHREQGPGFIRPGEDLIIALEVSTSMTALKSHIGGSYPADNLSAASLAIRTSYGNQQRGL